MKQNRSESTKKSAFRSGLRQSIFLPIILGLVIGGIFLWETRNLEESMRWLDHTDQAISRANHILKLYIDAETGARGFDINREEIFLKPFENAVKLIHQETESLENFVADNPSQIALLKEVETAGTAWFEIANTSISGAKSGGDIFSGSLNHKGKTHMDEIRKELGLFIDNEETLRAARQQESLAASRLATNSAIALGVVLCAFLLLWSRRILRSLSWRYEAALDEAVRGKEWFQTTLTSIGDAVIVVNAKAEVEFINPVASDLTGWQESEALGKPMADVFHIINEETGEPAFNPVERVLKEGIVVGLANHTVLIGKDGREFPIEDSAAPIKGHDGEIYGVVLVFRDVTERKDLTTDLESAVRSRDDFLSIASHELKTPLTTLKLQLQLGLLDGNTHEDLKLPPEKPKRIIEICFEQTKRLEALIEGLLDVARIQQGKLQFHFESADLTEVVKKTVEQLRPQLEAMKCSITLELSEKILATFDKIRIEQVVNNLISNAMKYGLGKPIKVGVQKIGSNALISVTDGGIGVAKEKRSVIFERFKRGVDSTGVSGLGLGLYIVNQIVLGHDGTVEVESEVNKGSTFSVTIPLQSTRTDFTLSEKELKEKI